MPAVFQGTTSLSFDAKGRMSVPTRYRAQIEAECGNRMVVTAHPDGCLLLFPPTVWEKLREQLMELPVSAHAWRRLLMGYAEEMELDSAGRILVTPELREYARIERDAVLSGVGAKFELWSKSAHAGSLDTVRGQPAPEAVRGVLF